MIYALAVLTTVLLVSLAVIHRLRELHHGYYGAILGFTAVSLGWPTVVTVVATLVLLDDTVQHLEEALRMRDRMGDFTPIHKLGAWLMGLDWKKLGWKAPLGIMVLMAVAAVYFAQRAMP